MVVLSTANRVHTPRTHRRRTGATRAPLVLAIAIVAMSAAAVDATAAPRSADCGEEGARKTACAVFPKEAPVQASSGRTVGTLSPGAHPVICRDAGGTVRNGHRRSKTWFVVKANTGRWGWVNTVYAAAGASKRVAQCPKRLGDPPETPRRGGPSIPPGVPGEPGLPTEPGDPIEPGDPAEPADPAEPGTPPTRDPHCDPKNGTHPPVTTQSKGRTRPCKPTMPSKPQPKPKPACKPPQSKCKPVPPKSKPLPPKSKPAPSRPRPPKPGPVKPRPPVTPNDPR